MRLSISRMTATTAYLSILVAAVYLGGAACSGSSTSSADGGSSSGSGGGSGGLSGSGSGGTSGSGSGGLSGSGSGGTSGSGSGGLGGSGSGGNSGSGSGGTSGSSSGGGSGSSGGVSLTGVCSSGGTRVLSNSQSNAFIDDFEEATGISPGWSSFNDVSPTVNVDEIMQVAGGAAGTAHAGQYMGGPAKLPSAGGFGAGTLYNTAIDPSAGLYCIDVSAFTGVSFWAKAASSTNATIEVDFVIPQQNPQASDGGVSGEGDCVCSDAACSSCYSYPHVSFTLTTSWAQYQANFASATGGAAQVSGVIQEVEWIVPTASWSFELDEIAFYSGTPPAGAVGPNPNSVGGDE